MPKTNAEIARELARLSSDCSFLLTHLVRQNEGRSDEEAIAILKSILDIDSDDPNPVLRASRVGWYGTALPNIFNPITGNFDGQQINEAVCFTESTLAGLKAHRDTFNVKYGVAFDRDLLFQKGANPCLNISESILDAEIMRNGERYPRHLFNFIPNKLHPFINVVHESFDATHEREWRVASNVVFNYEECLFVFCPRNCFEVFSQIQTNGFPTLFDLAWLDRV